MMIFLEELAPTNQVKYVRGVHLSHATQLSPFAQIQDGRLQSCDALSGRILCLHTKSIRGEVMIRLSLTTQGGCSPLS